MRLSELEGRRVGIWGAGREGRAAAAAVERAGGHVEVMATDEAPSDLDRLDGCEVVIRSPGVSRYRPELARMAEAGVVLTTGTNLFFAEPRTARVLGVSGTKGKSTTSAMLAHLLRCAGDSVELGGNIGRPLLDLLALPEPDFYVVELSSFQISDLERGPDIAVMLNLYREHTDWHGSEEAYGADKLRLLGLDRVRIAVVNARDPRLSAAAGPGVEMRLFGNAEPPSIEAMPVRGEHNRLNLAAAIAAAGAVGVQVPDVHAAMSSFVALPHRLETVTKAGGVTWVNDSIATTPEATIAALETFSDQSVILIAGGYDRGQDYGNLGRAIAEHPGGATFIALLDTGRRIAASVPGERAHDEAKDLEAAVALASRRASNGSVVLLSPAAPSFGAFRDFEERGERFRAAVTSHVK
ncbi:MAG: UDP-N-acetylmuramoyl-L-alanine--D-glutamate ligase [Thermoleophilaceae bacterium]|nr:UDP-N-acetylmuramoyl-L-alanine--D-glutamate ligase [Thermoleophilaceae bacterium]